MAELIGHNGLRSFVLGQPFGKAAKSVLHADFHRRWREHFLEAGQSDLAARKSVVGNERGSFGESHCEISLAQSLAVEHTKVALYRRPHPLAGTEALLAADIEGKFCL